jgi:type I restriction enzyme S subunit
MEAVMDGIQIERYPAYKDSGVKWLGEIPEHWDLTRLGTRFEERRTKVSDKDFSPLSVTKNGILPQLDNAAKTNDGDNRKLVMAGDFVINSRSDRKGSSGIALTDGSVSLINIVMEPKGIYPIFCNYLLKSYAFVEEFYRMGHGIVADLWTTRYDEMKAITVGIPPLHEQTAIAAFLDRKTAQVDKAISIKEKQIELLKERRQILIHKAVTRGLNPDVKLKDSGVEWIGEIPEGWEVVTKMKFISSLKGRQGWQGLKAEEYKAEGPHVLSSAHFNNYVIDWDSCPRVSIERYLMDVHIQLKIGDILLMKDGANMGKLAIVEDLPGLACLNSHLLLFRSLIVNGVKYYFPKFMFYHMMCVEFQDYVKINGTGSTFLGISQESIGNYPICLPPFEEQKEITNFIERISNKIATAISIKEIEIEKLKEYKASLINSAVTGKIKVI